MIRYIFIRDGSLITGIGEGGGGTTKSVRGMIEFFLISIADSTDDITMVI